MRKFNISFWTWTLHNDDDNDAEDTGARTHHLVAIPGLGTLTARGLTGGDLEDLGGETDGWGAC